MVLVISSGALQRQIATSAGLPIAGRVSSGFKATGILTPGLRLLIPALY
jgi:hypothetical protein